MSWRFTERPEWRGWLTPRAARQERVHRWYLFPHSFTGNLVDALSEEWQLGSRDRILDPFVGSGTTLLAAKNSGVPADGYDLSPLAVLASKTKVAKWSQRSLTSTWRVLCKTLSDSPLPSTNRVYPDLVQRALPDGRLDAFDAIASKIACMRCAAEEREFFRLALIAILPRFSHAVANGGWLRWLNEGADAKDIVDVFSNQVDVMLVDVSDSSGGEGCWEVSLADARSMPAEDSTYSAVITSPPYPNRHDYTRVFGVELMFAFQDWEANRALRYQMFHSHPEGKPKRPGMEGYEVPRGLDDCVRDVHDKRLRRMLRGYFMDMYVCLREVYRVCQNGAKVAFVVGNAQYDGRAVLVDEFTAELGESVGLLCKEIRAVRWRGNSAQQMGKYGRRAARESVVIFEKGRVV